MQSNIIGTRSILVLADDSANWVVAGVRQLDRLALAANESGIAAGDRITLHIFWNEDRPTKGRWFPQDARLTNCLALETNDIAGREYDAILTTRVFIGREAFGGVLAGLQQTNSARMIAPGDVNLFTAQFATRIRAMQTSKWWYIDGETQLDDATQHFLQTSVRPQDGIVSRLLNRHLSRAITHRLLPLHFRPTTLTLGAFIFSFVGFLCLAEGSRAAQLIGALLYQIHSIVGGCDGELARAKYRESTKGRWVDEWTNRLATALLVFGTGIGLFRENGQSLTLVEGVVCGLLVAVEGVAGSWNVVAPVPLSADRTTLFGSDTRLLRRAAVGAIAQLAKRDVVCAVFLLLVLIDRPGWFLDTFTIFMMGRVALGFLRTKSR